MRALSDAPVTVTGVEVARDGDGVSYISLGFPGATVQLLQKLAAENLADELRRLAPDIVVLAFGTNEGFNDALDVAAYSAQYEQIVHRLQALRPGLRVVMIGPPDGARAGVCHDCAVGTIAGAPPRRRRRRRAMPPANAAQARASARRAAPARRARRRRFSGIGRPRCRARAARRSGPPPTRR